MIIYDRAPADMGGGGGWGFNQLFNQPSLLNEGI